MKATATKPEEREEKSVTEFILWFSFSSLNTLLQHGGTLWFFLSETNEKLGHILQHEEGSQTCPRVAK